MFDASTGEAGRCEARLMYLRAMRDRLICSSSAVRSLDASNNPKKYHGEYECCGKNQQGETAGKRELRRTCALDPPKLDRWTENVPVCDGARERVEVLLEPVERLDQERRYQAIDISTFLQNKRRSFLCDHRAMMITHVSDLKPHHRKVTILRAYQTLSRHLLVICTCE